MGTKDSVAGGHRGRRVDDSASDPRGGGGSAAGPDPNKIPTDNERTITLVTGDVVALSDQQGKQTARVVTDVAPRGDVTFAKIGDDLYALPGAAIRMLAEGQLDRRLFNLSLLTRDGFADKPGATLPVIVSYRFDQADRV